VERDGDVAAGVDEQSLFAECSTLTQIHNLRRRRRRRAVVSCHVAVCVYNTRTHTHEIINEQLSNCYDGRPRLNRSEF